MGVQRHYIQRGYALLLMLLLLMGAGGIALASFTQTARQEAEVQRYEHNKRVLREAKQALLMYAYNYPDFANGGPGRLPCPYTDDPTGVPPNLVYDGLPDTEFDCEVGGAGPGLVGRFPFNANGMDFYEARDASGEHLWYAVSSEFAHLQAGTDRVNSDNIGTITLVDQSGEILYDGAVNGLAALIIAPGPRIRRDEDGNGSYEFRQLRDTNEQRGNPRNYLDTFNGFDNRSFVNGSNAVADSFIIGPVFDINEGETVVNDQMIIVTADEVIEMAEKRVLQAYRDAINRYRNDIVADAYPWLDDYTTIDLTRYDGDVGTRLGRVPSMFAEYFNTNDVNGQDIVTDLVIETSIDGFDATETIAASPTPDVTFLANGNLRTSILAPHTITRYYWDGHDSNTPSSPADGIWEICPVVTGTEEDCNQDGANNFIGGSSSVDWMKVRLVTITLSNGTPGVPFEFPYSDRSWPGVPLAFTAPNGTSHARVRGRYNNNSLYLNATWIQDDDFLNSFTESPVGNNGTLVFDGGDTLDVSLIYYPSLPAWALAAEDDWHDSIQFGYAAGYAPGGGAACTVGTDCLTVENTGGANNDKIAVLTLAGEHTFVDAGLPGYQDDLGQIFDAENAHQHDPVIPGSGDDDPNDGILDQDVFAVRSGNDSLLVIR